ncbi:prokaryotic E2 ligase family D protein [Alistipes sp. OttesenSCG-928-L06]|nr:prokaryotic E2 ligase family D protein [Alistipes sp. OttesenSCG-928-L06]
MLNGKNELTNEILSCVVPTMALIAFRGTGRMDGEFYLEARPIGADGKMGAGQPVPYKFMQEIAENYTEAAGGTPYGAIPDNLLYCNTRRGSEKYIWFNKPQKRTMYFNKSLGIPDGEYHVPGVIYVASEGQLNIYAFTDKVPKDETKLFAGPFFNTTNGSVCLGTSKIQKPNNPTFGELTAYWEKRFWNTEFTHLGGGGNPTKDNLVIVTKNAADKPFDLSQLRPMNKKLKDITTVH